MTDNQVLGVLAGLLAGTLVLFRSAEQWIRINAKGEAMSKRQESEKLVEDLKTAMRAVGKALVDNSVPVPRRIDRAMGILSMYDCEPKEAKEPAHA